MPEPLYSKTFEDSVYHPRWPKVADAVSKAEIYYGLAQLFVPMIVTAPDGREPSDGL